MKSIVIEAKLWKYEGSAAWYFLSSSFEQAPEIRKHQKAMRGWRSIPVRVTIGTTAFDTSLFPTKEGPYVLPIKASVRKSEGLTEGDVVRATCAFR